MYYRVLSRQLRSVLANSATEHDHVGQGSAVNVNCSGAQRDVVPVARHDEVHGGQRPSVDEHRQRVGERLLAHVPDEERRVEAIASSHQHARRGEPRAHLFRELQVPHVQVPGAPVATEARCGVHHIS